MCVYVGVSRSQASLLALTPELGTTGPILGFPAWPEAGVCKLSRRSAEQKGKGSMSPRQWPYMSHAHSVLNSAPRPLGPGFGSSNFSLFMLIEQHRIEIEVCLISASLMHVIL
jgi:hypothetical protein